MKNVFLLSLLLIGPTLLQGQINHCGCFNGIGSSEKDQPILSVGFSNGQKISVCGYEQKKLSANEVFITEFNIFDCETGKSLVEYGAAKNCKINVEEGVVEIIELKNLPAGENWEWMQVPIGIEQVLEKENRIVATGQKPKFSNTNIETEQNDSFYQEIEKAKSKGSLKNAEEIIGKLEVLALNKEQKAREILFDFENYFKYTADGAIAEQLKDAVATVKWIAQ